MKKLIPSLVLAFVFFSSAKAVEPAHQEAIEKMFKLMYVQEQYEISLTAGFETALGGALDQMPAEQKPKFKAAIERVQEFMKTEIGWDKIKGEFIELYAKNLTLEEINAVLPLMEKPEFQAVAVKQLKFMPEIVQIGASKAQALQPEIMKIVQEEMAK